MKTELGKESRLWRNMTCALPYEVADQLGIKPGDHIQFFKKDGRIEVEKAQV